VEILKVLGCIHIVSRGYQVRRKLVGVYLYWVRGQLTNRVPSEPWGSEQANLHLKLSFLENPSLSPLPGIHMIWSVLTQLNVCTLCRKYFSSWNKVNATSRTEHHHPIHCSHREVINIRTQTLLSHTVSSAGLRRLTLPQEVRNSVLDHCFRIRRNVRPHSA
jgi:hypothetical protein